MEINRRTFFGLGVGVLATQAMPMLAAAQVASADQDFADELIHKYMKVTPLEIAVNAKKPFKIFHCSDTHITCWGPKDIRDKKDFQLYERRSKYFNTAMPSLAASIAYAKKKKLPMFHTGDLLDFENEANLNAALAAFRGDDFFFVIGNHEAAGHWSSKWAPRNAKTARKQRTRMEKYFPNPLMVASRVINGINFVAFDNGGQSNWESNDVFAKVKAEFAKGLPVVLMCHMPFYTKGLFEETVVKRKQVKAENFGNGWVAGVPGKSYPAGLTALMKWVKTQKLLKTILCGHTHWEYQDEIAEGVTQYVAGGNYEGCAYEITFM